MVQKLTRPDLAKLSESDKDTLIMALFDHIDAMWKRIETLEGQVRKNSSNSSKPPSSDGLSKTKKTQSLRASSGKRPGGQTGRKGTTLKRTEATQVMIHPLPGQCAHCAAALSLEQAQVWSRRQVIDIPVAKFDVVEHQALAVACHCGPLNTSTFPVGVNEPVQYGANVRALAVHLTQGQMLPFARAVELPKVKQKISGCFRSLDGAEHFCVIRLPWLANCERVSNT